MRQPLLLFAAGQIAGGTALRGRKLCEDLAPRNGGTRLSGEGGAKRPADLPAELRLGAGSCVKILLPETEPQGFAGRGEQKAKAAGRPRGRKALAGM